MTHSRRRRSLFILVSIIVIAGVIFVFTTNREPKENTTSEAASSQTQKSKQAEQPAKSKYSFVDVQPVVEAWAREQSGEASVIVYDLANQQPSAIYNADQPYFAASIYKLFVAYEGYKQISNGEHTLADTYLGAYDRGGCLDAMIRASYSPCGEKMWVEIGKENLTKQLEAYGIKDTSMTALRTTAYDASLILERLYEKQDINQELTDKYLDSLKTQESMYRRGLPSGFSDKVTVYDKVGWNELKEWHDAAIVTMPNGQSYVMVVFTENIGSKNIANLAGLLEAKLSP